MNASPVPAPRRAAFDTMRGIVMALMVVDHVDMVVNPDHAAGDARFLPQVPLSPPDFLTRWSSHLCAPTFVFLAGMGIALGAAKRSSGAFDRGLLLRGLVLITLEFVVLSPCFRSAEGGLAWAFASWLPVFAQVVYAIGAAMLAMVALRRMPIGVQALMAGGLLLVCEPLALRFDPTGQGRLAYLLLVDAGTWAADGQGFDVLVLYPALPWLAVMLLGHAVGGLEARGALAPRTWLLVGVAAIAGFVGLRAIDGFGNLGLHRRDGSLLEWLHCSKYPPSITFLLMELGLMALALAALRWREVRAGALGPVARAFVVLGRTPLFFYLLHLVLIGVLAGLGLVPARTGNWAVSWAVAFGLTALCWLPCLWYGRYKHGGGRAWTRYL